MPQLDTSTFASQLFWLCICFFSMLFIMSKFIIPKIADVLEQRQRKIDGYLTKAHQIKIQAEETLKKYQDALSEANQHATQALSKTQIELNSMIEKKQNELNAQLQKMLQEGEIEIAKSQKEAINKVKAVSEDLALDIVKKIGLKDISSADIKAAIKTIEVE